MMPTVITRASREWLAWCQVLGVDPRRTLRLTIQRDRVTVIQLCDGETGATDLPLPLLPAPLERAEALC